MTNYSSNSGRVQSVDPSTALNSATQFLVGVAAPAALLRQPLDDNARGSQWRHWMSALSVIGCIAVFVNEAAAQTYTWTSQSSGNFSNGSNWLGGVAPPMGGSPSGTLLFRTFGTGNTSDIEASNDRGAFQFNKIELDNYLFSTLALSGSGANTLSSAGSAEILQTGLGLTTIASTSNFDSSPRLTLGGNLRIGGSTDGRAAFGLGDIAFQAPIAVGAHTLTIGNGATGNAPTANTRVIRFDNQNTFAAGGGVALDGGNVSIGANGSVGGTTTLNSGLGASGGTFTVTANGGTLQANAAMNSLAVSNFQLNGNLDLIGAQGITLVNTQVAGSGGLTIRNSSTTALTVQSNSNAYTGVVATNISRLPEQSGAGGTLILNGTNGSMTGVSTFNIFAGGGLTISSNFAGSTVNNDRVGDAATINLRNGSLTMTGAVSAVANTEAVGAVTGAGYNTVTVTPGAGAAFTTLTAASLARNDRGTFLFRGTNLGSAGSGGVGNILFTAPPVLVGGGGAAGSTNVSILPYAIGDPSASGVGTSFVTYGAFGIRPLNVSTEYQLNSLTGTDRNVRVTSSIANNSTVTVNSLFIAGGAITGAGTINVGSGAVLIAGSSISNHLAFGSNEGLIFSTSDGSTITGDLTGSNGLTKSGIHNLTLAGNNTGLTGRLTLNSGSLSFGALNSLAGSGQILVNAGGSQTSSINYTGSSAINIDRDINIGGGWLTVRNTGTGAATLSGTISGDGGLYVRTGATVNDLFLTGNNTYTGPTRIVFGRLHINSDANLGDGGAFDFAGSATYGVYLEGNWTTNRHINFSAGSVLNTQGFDATWNGVVTGLSPMFKAGAGTLTMNAANTFRGAVVVNSDGGTVALDQNGTLLANALTVHKGGRFLLDNATLPTSVASSGNVTTNRLPDSSPITLTRDGALPGGVLQMLGNSGASVTERVGNFSVSGFYNTIQVDSLGGQATALSLSDLNITNGTVIVRGTNLGALSGTVGRVFLTNFNGAAATNGQLLRNVFAEDSSSPFVDTAFYDTTVGIRLIRAADSLNGAAIQNAAPTNTPTTANFRVDPTVASPIPILGAANTINSLRFAPAGVADYAGAVASTLTISSGSIATEVGGSGAAMTNSGAGQLTLSTGALPLTFAVNSNLAVAARIAGAGGVWKAGAGTLTLSGPYASTGRLVLLGGTLNATGASLNGNGALAIPSVLFLGGNSPNILEFTSQELTQTGQGVVATFDTGNTTIPNAFILPSFNGTSIFTNGVNSNQTVTLSGVISGGSTGTSAALRLAGPADNTTTFRLTNPNNTFTGTVNVSSGTLSIAANSALGNPSNSISLTSGFFNPGGLRFEANFTGANTLNRNIFLAGGGQGIDTNGFDVDATGVFSGDGSIVKNGAGVLTIANGANTQDGGAVVNAGTLRVNGNMAGSFTSVGVFIRPGATLSGTGTIAQGVQIDAGGTLAPGASIGTLTVTNRALTLNSGPTGGWDIELNAVPANTIATAAGAPDVDILALNGAASNLNLVASSATPLRINVTKLNGEFDIDESVNYIIATASAGSNFRLNGAAFSFNASMFQITSTNFNAEDFSLAINGNRLILSFTGLSPVPEPATASLVLLAGVAAYVIRRRRTPRRDGARMRLFKRKGRISGIRQRQSAMLELAGQRILRSPLTDDSTPA
jgi:fibronectin-binding autotransporter adhesin